MKQAAAQRHARHSDATTKGSSESPRKAAADTSDDAPKMHVGRELADTTWRMAVPVVLCAGLGVVVDRQTGSGPWLTLTGMLVGFALAGVLVRRQIGRWPSDIKPDERKYKNYYKDEDDEKDYYND